MQRFTYKVAGGRGQGLEKSMVENTGASPDTDWRAESGPWVFEG